MRYSAVHCGFVFGRERYEVCKSCVKSQTDESTSFLEHVVVPKIPEVYIYNI